MNIGETPMSKHLPCPDCGNPHPTRYRVTDPTNPAETVPAWHCDQCGWQLH